VTDAEIHAEAKRRVQRWTPSITDDQWNRWLADALGRGATIVLQLDGCRAAYPLNGAPQAAGAAR
jgi:hypothetical protein